MQYKPFPYTNPTIPQHEKKLDVMLPHPGLARLSPIRPPQRGYHLDNLLVHNRWPNFFSSQIPRRKNRASMRL